MRRQSGGQPNQNVRLAQAVVFMVTLTLNVHVRASDPTSNSSAILSLPKDTALTEVPENCLLHSDHCAIQTSARGKYKFPVGLTQVVMSNNTSVIKSTAEGVTFMAGAIWVQTPGSFTVDTEFGDIHSASDVKTEFWIVQRDGKVWAQAIENSIYLRPRGGQTDIRLDAGEEVWMAGVQTDGLAATGIAQPIFFPDFAHQWALVYPGDHKSFKEKLDQLEVRFKEAAANIAASQEELVQRQVASEKAAEQSMVAHQAKTQTPVADHDKKMRELFREKVLGD